MSTGIQFVSKGKQPASESTGLTGTTYTNTDLGDHDRDLTRSMRFRDGELGNVEEEGMPGASRSGDANIV